MSTHTLVSLTVMTLAACTSTSSGIKSDPAGGGGTTGGSGATPAGAGGSAAGGAGMAQAGAAGAAAKHDCKPGRPGPVMVEIPVPGGQPFCIDSTKVTVGQYQEFLKAKGSDVSGQPPECVYNKTFAPEQTDPTMTPQGKCGAVDYLLSDPTHVMWCADWCDARAYCAWAGKRLCSGLGGAKLGLAADPAFPTQDLTLDATGARSELTYVCSQGGKTTYAYGTTFDASKSAPAHSQKLAEKSAAEPASHGTLPPFDEVSGEMTEILEWENGCADGACRVRGLVFTIQPDPAQAACAAVGSEAMSDQALGFRCCSD